MMPMKGIEGMTPQERKIRQAEAFKRWSSKPEVRARRTEYRRRWYAEHKARTAERYTKPEIKKRRAEYYRRYYSKPEVKRKHVEEQRLYYIRNREKILASRKDVYDARRKKKETG